MIEIMNLRNLKDRRYWAKDPFDMKVDRSSPVGNPTDIDEYHDRDWVCNEYEREFERYMEVPFFRAYIESLINIYRRHGRLRLWCWCAPKRCHAETIKSYIEERMQK